LEGVYDIDKHGGGKKEMIVNKVGVWGEQPEGRAKGTKLVRFALHKGQEKKKAAEERKRYLFLGEEPKRGKGKLL